MSEVGHRTPNACYRQFIKAKNHKILQSLRRKMIGAGYGLSEMSYFNWLV